MGNPLKPFNTQPHNISKRVKDRKSEQRSK